MEAKHAMLLAKNTEIWMSKIESKIVLKMELSIIQSSLLIQKGINPS